MSDLSSAVEAMTTLPVGTPREPTWGSACFGCGAPIDTRYGTVATFDQAEDRYVKWHPACRKLGSTGAAGARRRRGEPSGEAA